MAARFPKESNYQNGFANGVTINEMPATPAFSGAVKWVDSNRGSDGNKGTRQRPYASLSKAITNTASNGGDVIMLVENHSETISDALNLDTTGVTIVGLGNKGQKPTFTLSGGNATDGFDIQVKDVSVSNINVVAGLANLVNAFDVDATGATLKNITFSEPTTKLHFITCITSGSSTDNVCDDLTVTGCNYLTSTDGSVSFMSVLGDIDNMTVSGNNYVVSDQSSGASGKLIAGTAGDDMQNASVAGNTFAVTTTATDTYVLVSGNDQTDNSGLVSDNYIGTKLAATSATNNTLMKGTGFRYFQNYIANDDTSGSTLIPTAT